MRLGFSPGTGPRRLTKRRLRQFFRHYRVIRQLHTSNVARKTVSSFGGPHYWPKDAGSLPSRDFVSKRAGYISPLLGGVAIAVTIQERLPVSMNGKGRPPCALTHMLCNPCFNVWLVALGRCASRARAILHLIRYDDSQWRKVRVRGGICGDD